MSSEQTYSIQGADLSIRVEAPWGTAGQMTEIFTSYDWDSELSLLAKLESEGAGESCPPGLILLRDASVYLHLCPNPNGTVTIYCTQKLPKKIFGIFKVSTYELVTKERAPHALALRAITKFMADDENWLQENIKEDLQS